MVWYHYPACLFAGAFLVNAIPHGVQGLSGNRFPTPFAKPPGKGLSSPQLNIAWAWINLLLFILTAYWGHLVALPPGGLLVAVAGAIAMSVRLSFSLAGKHRE